MKTKDRIILASLDLFNEQGERNVSTNHIAAHLNMSPGNLYYHFRNKSEIVYQIFKSYELLVDTYLHVPPSRAITLADLIAYLDSVFNGLWAYRFFHRDLEHLLDSDALLRSEYRIFTLRCIDGIKSIIAALEQSELFAPQRDQDRESKALNVWLLVTNWMTFLKSMHHDQSAPAAQRDAIRHGVYQVLDFIVPSVVVDQQGALKTLQSRYHFDGIIPDLRPETQVS